MDVNTGFDFFTRHCAKEDHMKYKRSVSVFLAVLALIPAMMTAGCSEESHIITQHTSRPDGTATSKPYATNNSLTKDDITCLLYTSDAADD